MAQRKKGPNSKASTKTKQSRKRKATSAATQRSSKRIRRAASKVKAESHSALLALPAELRNEIYKLVLVDTDDNTLIRNRPWKRIQSFAGSKPIPKKEMREWEEPPLLQVCMTVRNEASAMYFGSHSFEVKLHLNEMENAVQWLSGIFARCGKNPFRFFTFQICQPQWSELKYLRSLVQLLYQTGLQLTSPPYRVRPGHISPGSILRSPHAYSAAFHNAMEEAVQLGKKAREDDWHEDWLDVEFGLWLEEKLNTGQGKETANRERRRPGFARKKSQRTRSTA